MTWISSRAIAFTFGLMSLGKVNPLIPSSYGSNSTITVLL